jgi:pimeloyl-ACP methyl ester carboxylesterase
VPTFSTGGLSFRYLDRGRGLPVAFQHGLGGDSDHQGAFFSEPTPFRLLSLDCRGHGGTEPLGDPAGLGFVPYADDLRAWLDHLGVPRAVVGGVSMGAGVALTFALRHPDRVLGLVLSRPAWLDEPLPPNLRVFPRIAALIGEHGARAGRARFLETADYRAARRVSEAGATSLLGQFDRPRAEETAVVLERLPHDVPTGHRADWGTVRVPTLVLANRLDPVHPFAYGETLARAIPGAEFRELTPKATDERRHDQEVRAAVDAFLAWHFAARPAPAKEPRADRAVR